MALTPQDIDSILKAQSPTPLFGNLTHNEIDQLMQALGKKLNDKLLHTVKAICPECDGHKQKWNSNTKMMENCPICNGSGLV